MPRNEPTTKQVYADADNLFAEMAFKAILRNNNPEMARQRLAMMSGEKLDHLAHVCRMLLVLAEAEMLLKQTKAGQE